MYIWRKIVDPHWLRSRSENLAHRFDTSLALIERPGRKHASLEIACRTRKQARELLREFGGKVVKLRRDWFQHFARKAQGKPLRIGSRLVILRSPPEPGTRLRRNGGCRSMIIPAETAFGTGEHATTAMCLRLLERITRAFQPGWTMLDAGTGSGILAIAGRYFGARRVLAIDSDPLACKTAKRNARANGVRNIGFSTGDILRYKLTGKFDIITANLFSEILIDAFPIWSPHLAPGGNLILSGILWSQQTAVHHSLRQHGLAASEVRRRGKWIAICCRNIRPLSA
jgi:ribosomal protein L11 methyltransferase